MKKDKLIFWFDAPPRAGAGAFIEIAEQWPENVYFICMSGLSHERLSNGWELPDYKKANIVILSSLNDIERGKIERFVFSTNTIHIFNGFKSKTRVYLLKAIKNLKLDKIIVWSERPNLKGNVVEKLFRKIYFQLNYRYLHYKYANHVRAFLPLGKLGALNYSQLGWKNINMFTFMYDPLSVKVNKINNKKEGNIKFIYLGRFCNKTKALGDLLSAYELIENKECSLTLVGGYGPDLEQTIIWINKEETACFDGKWKSNEIIEKLSAYDVMIIPSKYDGWNVVVNEAIRAGIGVIVSDQAVSHELIEASGAGLVFKAGNINDLKSKLEYAIENPNKVSTWKRKAIEYMPKISSEVVARYFIDIINYTFYDKNTERPIPPWLK